MGRGLARRIPSSSIQLKMLPSEEPKAGLSVFSSRDTRSYGRWDGILSFWLGSAMKKKKLLWVLRAQLRSFSKDRGRLGELHRAQLIHQAILRGQFILKTNIDNILSPDTVPGHFPTKKT